MAHTKLLKEYIRATMMSLPDSRTGSGYGSTGKSASGLGTQYQKNASYPYREPDIEGMEADEDTEDADSTEEDEETHQAIQNKTLGIHRTPDPHKRRDYGSYSGHSVRFDLHQGHEPEGPILTSETMGVTGRSISPIPNLYKGRMAGGATGGVSPVGLTTGPAHKGGITSKRKFSSAQPLEREEQMPRKFKLIDILFGVDDDDETLDHSFVEDEEVKVEEEV